MRERPVTDRHLEHSPSLRSSIYLETSPENQTKAGLSTKNFGNERGCLRNFLENDIRHLENEINECNNRYSYLIKQRESLVHVNCDNERTSQQVGLE